MTPTIPSDPFTPTDAALRGIHPQTLHRMLARGVVRRLLWGVYIAADKWEAADSDTRRLLCVQAALRRRPSASASHASALAVHGLPVVMEPLRRIDVVDDVAQTVRRSGMWVHPRRRIPAVGTAVTVALALAQTASLGWRRTAVVAADAAIRRGHVTAEELLDAATRVQCPALARLTLCLADGRMESPGESLTRLALRDVGCWVEPQREFVVEGRRFRVDFLVTHRRWPGTSVIVEFDGQRKYADSSDGAVLFAEKQREDLLRRTGHPLLRVVWADLMRDDVVPRRLWETFAHHRTA